MTGTNELAPSGRSPRAGLRRAAVVVNHASGRHGSAGEISETILAILRENGIEGTLFADGDLMERLRSAASSEPDLLVAGGGDGTIAAAGSIAMNAGLTLAVVPLGTMNLLAKDVGLPIDVAEAARLAATGEARRIDVGVVTGGEPGAGRAARRQARTTGGAGEHVFLCAVMMGLPARLARHRERERGAFGPLAWARLARATFASLSRYPSLRVALDVGHGPRLVRTRALTVANNALDEGFGGLFSRASLEDGSLAVYILRDMGPVAFVRFLATVGLGDWSSSDDIEAHRVETFSVSSRRTRLRVMLDGEVRLIAPPLTFSIRKRALSIVGPPKTVAPDGTREDTGAEHRVGVLEAAESHAPEPGVPKEGVAIGGAGAGAPEPRG